ncbi:MAG: Ig-like domain-containing protein [Thermoanaerobaculia bacterium]|nr:Ig-like domain-containing protein [Thermoanaerobaculia bacterium]
MAGETVSGVVLVQGWSLTKSPISKIELYVDDQFLHEALIDIPRIDIVETYPTWAGVHATNPGFQIGFLASRLSNGPHTIHMIVVTEDNRTWEIGRRTILVDNTKNQSPFGRVDIPNTQTIHDASGSFPVVGWVTDTDGIERVDILVDNLVMQQAIYGDPRPDVAVTFPDFPGAMFSGFIAHMDSSRLLNGVHTLTVRAVDRLGLARTIAERKIQVFNTEANLAPFGFLDQPLRDDVLYGTNCGVDPGPIIISPTPAPGFRPPSFITPVRGWALDLGTRKDTGRVAYAELLIDGVRWLSTDDCFFHDGMNMYLNCYGMQRFDVQRYYPNYPDAPRSGFVFGLDVGALLALGVSPGLHDMKVRVGDKEQTFADLPGTAGIPVFFECADNVDNFDAFGYIDFPGPMDYVNGDVIFRGWALDRDPGGVQSVEVWVDGVLAGVAQYGLARPDVQTQFGMVTNSLNSGWRFTFDTRQLSNARHRVTVRAIDASGTATIIGSRDFYTANQK